MLGMAPLQQTVPAHVQPVVGAVVAQYFRMLGAPSKGQVPQRVDQQVAAERRPLQMRLEMVGTQRHLAPQAGFKGQSGPLLVCTGGAAVARHLAALLLTLGADEAASALNQVAPGLADADGAEAVATGEGVGLAKDVAAHGAGQLQLQGRHRGRVNANNDQPHHVQGRRSLI